MAGTHIGGKNDRAFFGAQVGVSVGSLRLCPTDLLLGEESGGHSERERENDLEIAPFLEKGRRRRRSSSRPPSSLSNTNRIWRIDRLTDSLNHCSDFVCSPSSAAEHTMTSHFIHKILFSYVWYSIASNRGSR